MARDPYANTLLQNLWKETVEKETKARFMALAKLRGQPRSKARQYEVFRKRIENTKPSDALLERLPPIRVETRYNKKKADYNCLYNIDIAKIDKLKEEPDMRPVSPLVKKTLYDGFTQEGKGRHIYLKQRHDMIPGEKFTNPSCTSWDYGWSLNDVIKDGAEKIPTYGRSKIVENSFYSRNGLETGCSKIH